MRRTLILLLLAATPLFAADAPERWRMSVLRVRHGAGFTAAYAPNARWDVELGVAEQRFTGPYVGVSYGPPPLGIAPVTRFKSYTVHPIDLSVRRRWTNGGRLTPYLFAGARYIDAPNDPPNPFPVPPTAPPAGFVPVTAGFHLHNRASAQAGAGTLVRLTPRTALRVEVARLARSDGAPFDPLTRVSAGLSWHF